MAANKFTAVLQRRTNRITLVLIYAVLEWILIALLLLNSLFSYLIIKFADYFGLQKPCLWCSRVDHLFEPGKNNSSFQDLVCEAHSKEISNLGFCLNHRKLVEFRDMCEDCSRSSWYDHFAFSKNFDLFPRLNQRENAEICEGEKLRCCCCGERSKTELDPSFLFFKSSWEFIDHTRMNNLITDEAIDEFLDQHRSKNDGEKREIQMVSDFSGEFGRKGEISEENSNCSVCELGVKEDNNVGALAEEDPDLIANEKSSAFMDEQREFSPQHLEFYIDQEDCRLIPVELTCYLPMHIENNQDKEGEDVVLDFVQPVEETRYSSREMIEEISSREDVLDFPQLVEETWHSSGEIIEEISSGEDVVFDFVQPVKEPWHSSREIIEEMCSGEDVVLDFVQPVLETWHSSREIIEVISSRGSGLELNVSMFEEKGELIREVEDQLSEAKRVEDDSNPVHKECNKAKDEESVEIKNQENEKLLPLNRKESGAEESFDGSVLSDMDSYEGLGLGLVSIEKLKSALRADRMALNALYAELEEERSASAVAANQTMAMINRLQEEKACMQMEASHYQRMMEEQSEFDQEALHILNELVTKREREKQELEKEVEIYRKRIRDCEAKEKMMVLRYKKEEISKSSSGFSSNGEESDEVLMAMNNEGKDEDRVYENGESKTGSTPADAVLYLEESLDSFEEERISIIEQLKLLEEKLFFLSDEEDNGSGNGCYENGDSNGRLNCYENGYHHREINGGNNHSDRRIMNSKPKRLLPLFDRTVEEEEEEEDSGEEEEQKMDKNGEGLESLSMKMTLNSKNESEEYKKIAIEEEVDHVYERLQALEEDREFLKHCIGSLRKGDKGLELLQEILHHLRDLRSVDLRVRGLNPMS